MSILEMKDVYYSYKDKYQTVNAIRGISCSFEQGKFNAIIGRSGSGKSTTLSLLAGLYLPSSGEIIYDGVPTNKMDLRKYRRNEVAVIYQNFRLFPMLTVLENVMYPIELAGIKGEEARERAKMLIQKVGLSDSLLNRFPSMISGGEQQRVAIARALGIGGRVILADEATGNLDSENSKNIISILMDLARKENYCVILATHDLDIAEKADTIIRMSDGKIIESSLLQAYD